MGSKFHATRPSGIQPRMLLRYQSAEIHRSWPMLATRVVNDTLIVSGEVQPTPLSETYLVRVTCGVDEVPQAFVDAPKLIPRSDGTPIPHVYPGPRPCLYVPGSGEWTSRKMIATTIIPWLMLWLIYYELWHATGLWQGGGMHPASGDSGADTSKVEPLPGFARQA